MRFEFNLLQLIDVTEHQKLNFNDKLYTESSNVNIASSSITKIQIDLSIKTISLQATRHTNNFQPSKEKPPPRAARGASN